MRLYKNLEIYFYYIILFLDLSICLKIKRDRKFLLNYQKIEEKKTEFKIKYYFLSNYNKVSKSVILYYQI